MRLNVKNSKLVKIPGVGKKTAERLLVELKGKFKGIQQEDFFIESQHLKQPEHALNEQDIPASEAISALIALGYKAAEAEKLVKKLASRHFLVSSLSVKH